MKKFWHNNELLSAEEQRLVDRLYEAHAKCVWRDNCSTMALQQAGGGSRSLPNALIAALASMGELHGPVEAAYDVLAEPVPVSSGASQIKHMYRVAGWGNSFIRGRIDDAFLAVDQTIEAHFPCTHGKLKDITALLHSKGKQVFPNPGAYTAATALILGMPRHLAPMLFIQARTEAWSELFHKVMVLNTKCEQKEAA